MQGDGFQCMKWDSRVLQCKWLTTPAEQLYISRNSSCEKDVKALIGTAATVFRKLKKRKHECKAEYEAIILTTLPCGSAVEPV